MGLDRAARRQDALVLGALRTECAVRGRAVSVVEVVGCYMLYHGALSIDDARVSLWRLEDQAAVIYKGKEDRWQASM